MDGAIWAAVVTGITGIIIAFTTARRGYKQDAATNELARHTTLIEGYGQIVKDLQAEMARTHDDCERANQRLRKRVLELEHEVEALKKKLQKRKGK